MKAKEAKKIPYMLICLCAALGMTGGFFDHSVAWIGVIMVGCMFAMLLTGAEFYERDRKYIFLIPMVLVCIAGLVSFWAIDYMDNLMGVMRLAVICLWMYMVRSRGKEKVL